jgi:aspartate racemase
VVRQPRIGILAGMGPRSTAPFIDLVVTECQVQYGARHDIDFPKMMICSQPAPFYEDRPIDHEALEQAIREGLIDLENAGADFLAIACNTAHIYYPQLAARARVPLLDMVEITLDSLPASVHHPALIAARPTIESGLYQSRMEQRGLQSIVGDWQSQTDELLGLIRTSTDVSVIQQAWRTILSRVESENADMIVVACLDLSGVIGHAQTKLPILDAAQCLAREVVKQWLLGREGAQTPAVVE